MRAYLSKEKKQKIIFFFLSSCHRQYAINRSLDYLNNKLNLLSIHIFKRFITVNKLIDDK